MKYLSFFGIFLAIVILLTTACTKTPDYPKEPQITYKGANKTSIRQGSKTALPDTLIFTFAFTDGDGDFGDNDSTTFEIMLYDSRDSFPTPGQVVPIPEQGSTNGISGEIIVTLPTKSISSQICCIFPDRRACFTDPRFPRDTFSYLVQIRDRAGNMSNMIRTETFTILCQ